VYTWSRHAYARAQRDGTVTVTIPHRYRHDKILYSKILHKAQVLLDKVSTQHRIPVWQDGKILLFGDYITLPALKEKKIDLFLHDLLYDYIRPLVANYANALAESYSTISIKQLRSKRGSCSYDQSLLFNRDLVHLPLELSRYIVIHEVCHLRHKHHQRGFRDEVEKFCPKYKEARRQLKKYHLIHS
jgi:predicted metal-dependent hydrolase